MGTIRMAGQPGVGATGGKVWPFNNIGTAPIQVVGRNAYREFITFANPGTQTIFVAPLNDATGAPLMPSLFALGGCFPVLSGAELTITGECQNGWQALAAAGLSNALTVFESNLS